MIARLSASLLVMLFVGLAQAAETAAAIAIPYKVAHDAPLAATESIVKESPAFNQLRVEFNGIEGDRVPAFLYLPKAAKSKAPGVLLQYGSGGNKKTDYIVDIGRRFVGKGFVVLTIDSPGRGERKPKEGTAGNGFSTDVLLHYMGDYCRAVDYLASRSEVDTDRLSYVGISMGAITGIPYVAHDQRIKAMVSMVGGGGFIADRTTDKTLKEGARRADPAHHVGLIAPRPLLMLNVTKDQLVPMKFAVALHNAAGKNSKIVWLETDHYFRGVNHGKMTEEIVIKFLEDHLPAK